MGRDQGGGLRCADRRRWHDHAPPRRRARPPALVRPPASGAVCRGAARRQARIGSCGRAQPGRPDRSSHLTSLGHASADRIAAPAGVGEERPGLCRDRLLAELRRAWRGRRRPRDLRRLLRGVERRLPLQRPARRRARPPPPRQAQPSDRERRTVRGHRRRRRRRPRHLRGRRAAGPRLGRGRRDRRHLRRDHGPLLDRPQAPRDHRRDDDRGALPPASGRGRGGRRRRHLRVPARLHGDAGALPRLHEAPSGSDPRGAAGGARRPEKPRRRSPVRCSSTTRFRSWTR